MASRHLILTSLILVCLLSCGCTPRQSFDARLNSIVKPHLFGIASWESKAIPHEINQWLFSRREKIDDEIEIVLEYFATTEQIKALKSEIGVAQSGLGESGPTSFGAELNKLQEQKTVLAESVERIIEKQVRDALSQQGIFNPVTESKVNFPPVNFKLEKPPHLLVVSPRERIESVREITLKPALILEEMEDIEARVDELGVSSLVVELGGLGATYPTLVDEEISLRSTIDTTIEEWLHQYLVFKPLGFRYLLDLIGLSRNYEITTMNETLAGMVSKEIGSIVYKEYYPAYTNNASESQVPELDSESEFDFNREMREIRRTVDVYLAQGEIEKAEEFMEQKRQYLVSMGYYIRKLNQAYFAFHGTYADRPTSISPIGVELRKLREQSDSLKEFLNTAAAMTGRQDLQESIK